MPISRRMALAGGSSLVVAAGMQPAAAIAAPAEPPIRAAIKTSDGHFLTAVNGGGIAGPNDWRSPFHTDAAQIGPWERFSLIRQPLRHLTL